MVVVTKDCPDHCVLALEWHVVCGQWVHGLRTGLGSVVSCLQSGPVLLWLSGFHTELMIALQTKEWSQAPSCWCSIPCSLPTQAEFMAAFLSPRGAGFPAQ